MKSLLECKNLDDICEVPRDHYQYGSFSIMTDGSVVWLTQAFSHSIEIPKQTFDILIRKYIIPDVEQNKN